MSYRRYHIFFLFLFFLMLNNSVFARDRIRFVSVDWTGVSIKTELGVHILKSLGYVSSNTIVSVPIVYKALHTGDADIFLGNWMPSMASIADKYFKMGSVKKYCVNMEGARYTLAVPSYVMDQGLNDFSKIAEFGDKLDWKIYGIESGNDGNKIIQSMIDKNMYELGNFTLIPSSETGMLSQVQSYVEERKWIVFLGWSPHYMNVIIDMKYLSGSTGDTFGANNGKALVFTNIRKGFDKENPNLAIFLKNFTFPISMMNQVMTKLNEDYLLSHSKAGIEWIKDHPEIYTKWFEGVKTKTGKPGLTAFKNYLKNMR